MAANHAALQSALDTIREERARNPQGRPKPCSHCGVRGYDDYSAFQADQSLKGAATKLERAIAFLMRDVDGDRAVEVG